MDIIGRAIQQLTTAKEIQPSFAILHPQDWWSIRLTKDSQGRYLLGDPQTNVGSRLFDLSVVSTTSITQGTFLIGSGDPTACEIRDRMVVQFEAASEHQDYFERLPVPVRGGARK